MANDLSSTIKTLDNDLSPDNKIKDETISEQYDGEGFEDEYVWT